MASSRTLIWTARDQLWLAATRYLVEAGYADYSEFIADIRAANYPQVRAWGQAPSGAVLPTPGSAITIPYRTV